MTTTDLLAVDPVMVGRLRRASDDLLARLGWTWVGYSRTSCTFAEQDVFWQAYKNPPHWPTAANPAARGWSIDLRGRAFTQHGSLHMLQPDLADPEHPDGYAAAVDIAWPGPTKEWEAVHALAAQPILAEHGLAFPINGEYWHCQAFDWNGEYLDHHEPAPMVQEDDDMMKLVHVNGATAVFIGQTTKFPSGLEGLAWVKWLRNGNVAEAYKAQGVEDMTVNKADLANVALVGGAPVGDTEVWADSDFA